MLQRYILFSSASGQEKLLNLVKLFHGNQFSHNILGREPITVSFACMESTADTLIETGLEWSHAHQIRIPFFADRSRYRSRNRARA